MNKMCVECGLKVSVERKRCEACVKIYNRKRAKKYYNSDKKRYGIGLCSICGLEMKLNHKNQMSHDSCRRTHLHKTVDIYNNVPRSKKGNTVARQMIFDLGFELPKSLVIHHVDENPMNNVLSNFWIISNKNHASYHSFLQKQRSLLRKLNSSNLENCWNSLRDQLTTTWLETTGVNVIKITDIGQSAAEPLNENYIYVFSNVEGSETMYQVPETGNAVGKDIVQTCKEV